MKKRLFLILSVTIMLAAGCGNKDNVVPDMETEATETVIDTEEPDMAEDKEVPAADQAENRDTEKEQTEKETAKETEQEEGDKEAEGKITQEEYNSYYPYDGLGYYSVFVETNLNEASTTSGRKLGSEDGIADYIAGMMLLETEPVFYIEYAGVYNLNGTDFYEFRCYR